MSNDNYDLTEMTDEQLKAEYMRLSAEGSRGDEDRFEEVDRAAIARGIDVDEWADEAYAEWERTV